MGRDALADGVFAAGEESTWATVRRHRRLPMIAPGSGPIIDVIGAGRVCECGIDDLGV
jgi:hypothetical protein